MMTISGDSGSQKTMFAQALMFRILKENPEFKAVFFEKEMPLEDLGRRIASWVLREDSNEMMRVISESRDIEQRNDILMQIRARMEQRFSENGEIKSMVNRLDLVSRDDFSEATDIWRILAQKQPDIWTLDFFTMLEPAGGIDDENMRKQAITLKNALLDTNSFGLVLSQLKQSNNVDMRANKVPMIGDMEWGKHLRQYSTWVFAIFYPHHYGIKVKDEQYFFLVSRKTRHGKAVIVPLLSDPSMALFTEPVGAKKGQMIEYINNYMTKGSNTDVFAKRSM
jgi:replicative DNA helicase